MLVETLFLLISATCTLSVMVLLQKRHDDSRERARLKQKLQHANSVNLVAPVRRFEAGTWSQYGKVVCDFVCKSIGFTEVVRRRGFCRDNATIGNKSQTTCEDSCERDECSAGL